MKKIINPWKGMEGYNCFGCAPNNEAGVKMEFYEDGDEVISIWKPQPQFQGWIDTLAWRYTGCAAGRDLCVGDFA